MIKKRVYLVTDSDGCVRLVRAHSERKALQHVAASIFLVREASQDDLNFLLANTLPPYQIEEAGASFVPPPGGIYG